MARHLSIALLAFAALGAGAFVSTGLEAAEIQACVGNGSGLVRIVQAPEECRAAEDSVSWAIEGPEGPQGPAGPTGPEGPVGPRGPRGSGGPEVMTWEIRLRAEVAYGIRRGDSDRAAAEDYDERFADVMNWTGQRLDGSLLPTGTNIVGQVFPVLSDGASTCVSVRDRIQEVALSPEACVSTTTCAPTDGSFPDDERFQVPLDVEIPNRVVELYVFHDITIRDECTEQNAAFGGSHERPWMTLTWSAS